MLKTLKNKLFPRIPARPPSREILQERQNQFVNRFVSAHAEGNVALSRGHFRIK